jgi:hypothetical protein
MAILIVMCVAQERKIIRGTAVHCHCILPLTGGGSQVIDIAEMQVNERVFGRSGGVKKSVCAEFNVPLKIFTCVAYLLRAPNAGECTTADSNPLIVNWLVSYIFVAATR